MTLYEELKESMTGEVCNDDQVRHEHSRDASVFVVAPDIVVFPKSAKDISAAIKVVLDRKKKGETVSITGRSAGTCMSGGSLTESVMLSFTRHMDRILEVTDAYAIAEPGTYYRVFEKETLKHGWLMPSYPASRELCALGGMTMNNAGGEKTLVYGKTSNYVKEVEMVLADSSVVHFSRLTKDELNSKKALPTFEGEIYTKVSDLIFKNQEVIERNRPQISKNSAGYALWDVYNKKDDTFDLSKLFVGSQGTLGILSKVTFTGVKPKKYSRLLVTFLPEIAPIGDVTQTLLSHAPETLESYDDKTLRIAVKYFFDIAKRLKGNLFSLAIEFIPEFIMVLRGGVPKLIVMAEFTGDDLDIINTRMQNAYNEMQKYGLSMRMTTSDIETQKYFTLRRESFNLLRSKLHGNRTAPFIDDIVVAPKDLPLFLPRLENILSKHPLVYTIAGHVGNGNFHIIPLMDLAKDESVEIIKNLSGEVYALVREFHGSITGEHNDGLIRTPFLSYMFDDAMIKLFEQVKEIFDPYTILNPGKKVHGSWAYAVAHIDRSHDDLEEKTYMPC